MIVQKRTLNWLPQQSAYHQATAARAKRKALAEDFISRQSSQADAFVSVQSNAITEQGNIVSRVAAARLKIKI